MCVYTSTYLKWKHVNHLHNNKVSRWANTACCNVHTILCIASHGRFSDQPKRPTTKFSWIHHTGHNVYLCCVSHTCVPKYCTHSTVSSDPVLSLLSIPSLCNVLYVYCTHSFVTSMNLFCSMCLFNVSIFLVTMVGYQFYILFFFYYVVLNCAV